jgi:hypothetical protein
MNVSMFIYHAEKGDMFMWGDTPRSYAVLENMTFKTIRNALNSKHITLAERA